MKKTKVTLDFLLKKNACEEGITWFKLQQKDEINVDVIVHNLITEDKHQWANWLLTRSLKKTALVKYAVFSARAALDIYESKYPEDKRPRNAIETAENYINNNVTSAAAYATAACAASCAAACASCDSHAAATAHDDDDDAACAACASCAAACAAACAACAAHDDDDAACAACAAACAACAAAAGRQIFTQILEHGITLLDMKEKNGNNTFGQY